LIGALGGISPRGGAYSNGNSNVVIRTQVC